MTATSNPNFGAETEGLEVAAAYSGSIKGRTIVITGVNQGGIGFSTAEAFVRLTSSSRHEVVLTVWTSLLSLQPS